MLRSGLHGVCRRVSGHAVCASPTPTPTPPSNDYVYGLCPNYDSTNIGLYLTHAMKVNYLSE